MSVVFQAAVILRSRTAAEYLDAFKMRGLVVEVGELVAIVPDLQRETPGTVSSVASELSRLCGRAAAIYFDDRTASREGIVFDAGEILAEYASGSEEWVLLDENGDPDLAGPRFLSTELAAQDEAQCVVTAIDRALASLGDHQTKTREFVRAIGAV